MARELVRAGMRLDYRDDEKDDQRASYVGKGGLWNYLLVGTSKGGSHTAVSESSTRSIYAGTVSLQ